jgi:hypothetical protein
MRREHGLRFVAVGAVGFALAFAFLVAGERAGNVPVAYIVGIAAGMVIGIACEAALLIAANRARVAANSRGAEAVIPAGAALQRENFAASMLIFAGIMLMSLTSMFGRRLFPGASIFEFFCLFAGLSMQMLAQARYITRLG